MTRCAQIFAAYRIERARAVIRTVRFLKEEKMALCCKKTLAALTAALMLAAPAWAETV